MANHVNLFVYSQKLKGVSKLRIYVIMVPSSDSRVAQSHRFHPGY